eukprot:CAMPEP_0184475272 /NCGR_PEP_ID=MMETSP0740-20130409/144886_1 /TAXON_ID=385413 /ORGANISM="Thalassiosira miniscula, Strain CCMP1093" /LENGTH=337 /DNA_ID=CAMNT_0026852709 /DNA_START=40 /DNA_END=1050 /DNA_ORIENTATION=+
MQAAPDLFSYRKFWAHRFGVAPELPMTREEMDVLGWDSCDIIIVTGDAYVDHPSFGMALIGRLLESHGFRVGIISQPDWTSAEDFQKLGKPNLFFGVTGGNMDSMVNRYTSDRKIRSNDAYTAGGEGGKRPDRSVVVYSQRCREAFKGVPVVIGGIEASLRRIAHYDYWSEKVRRSVIMDAKADLLVYGNGERQVVEIAHRLAAGESVKELTDIRGTAYTTKPGQREGWWEKNSTSVDTPGKLNPPIDPYQMQTEESCAEEKAKTEQDKAEKPAGNVIKIHRVSPRNAHRTVIRLPAYHQVKDDPVTYAHTSRILHLETNPGNALALVQEHGNQDVW